MTVRAAQGSDGIGYPLTCRFIDFPCQLLQFFICDVPGIVRRVAYVAGHMKYGPSPDIRYNDECNDRTFDGKGIELGRMSWSGYSEHE